MNKMDKAYLIKYTSGSYDTYFETEIFVTPKKEIAEKYVAKFNSLLNKMKEFYSEHQDEEGNLKEEYYGTIYSKWIDIQEINRCYFLEIEIRK